MYPQWKILSDYHLKLTDKLSLKTEDKITSALEELNGSTSLEPRAVMCDKPEQGWKLMPNAMTH